MARVQIRAWVFKRFSAALWFVLLVGCQPDTLEVPVAYEGYLGDYPGFSLVLDERFNAFDEAVWTKGDGAVGKESACRFQDEGVRVQDGVLELLVLQSQVAEGWSEDHQKLKTAYDYLCGEVRTRPELRVRYGRIETRLRAPDRASASGYISSLFTYVNDLDEDSNRVWEEIDIELEGGRPEAFQANLIYGVNALAWSETREYGAWEDKIEVGPVDRWRVFAIEWLPEEINWYVDGALVKTLSAAQIDCDPECVGSQKHPTPIPVLATDIMMNFWIPNDTIQNVFGGNKALNKYPMRAQYDWLRIYQYDAEPMENWSAR